MAHKEQSIIVVPLASFCCRQIPQNLGSSFFNLFRWSATCVTDGFDSELLSARLLFRVYRIELLLARYGCF